MQPTHSTTKLIAEINEQRRTSRVKQAERFEVLSAASEAENICPVWISDRLAESERVSS